MEKNASVQDGKVIIIYACPTSIIVSSKYDPCFDTGRPILTFYAVKT